MIEGKRYLLCLLGSFVCWCGRRPEVEQAAVTLPSAPEDAQCAKSCCVCVVHEMNLNAVKMT